MMDTLHYPVIQVRGGPYERGQQHGEQARDRIEACVDIYRSAFSRNVRLDWTEVVRRARWFADVIEGLDPAIMTEMRGIANGSGLLLEEIVALNCRTEILFGVGSGSGPKPETAADECTTIAVTPNASAGGKMILGKNWDRWAVCGDTVVVIQVEQDEGPDFVTVVEAGMVGRDGFNEAGIAICGNLMRSTKDGGKPGVPIPVIRRRVLNSQFLDDALDAVLHADRAASTNYVVAHDSGIVINFEAAPDQVFPIYPEAGLLTHSNHFTAVAAQVQAIGCGASPDSLYRHQRVRDLLEPKIGCIRVEDVQEALRDHAGHPQSVCRHPNERQLESERSASIASIVIDLTDRVMHVASGPPCRNEYQTVALPVERHRSTSEAPTAVSAGL